MASTAGQMIKCRAAILHSFGSEFTFDTINVDPPQSGEVRIKILYTSLCHTDTTFPQYYSKFPLIAGHEGSGVVESVGAGVTDVAPGDSVIPIYQGECGSCKLCKLPKTNHCEISSSSLMTQVMPFDGNTRFSLLDGTRVYHFGNTSTFTEYTVVAATSVVKVDLLPLDIAPLLGCGVPTGLGSSLNIAKVEAGSTVAVIGLGTVGLAAVEGARMAGAARIIGIDIIPQKLELAKSFGATECLNPRDHEEPLDEVLNKVTDGSGVDYCIECVGNTQLLLQGFKGTALYGTTVMVGLPKADEVVALPPMHLLLGRQLKSGFFGGFRGKSDMRKLMDLCHTKEVNLDAYITHRLPFSQLNEGVKLLSSGSCIKCVFNMEHDT